MNRPGSRHALACQMMLLGILVVSIGAWRELRDLAAWVVGWIAVVAQLACWANTLWVRDQLKRLPGDLPEGESRILRRRLLRGLWGGLALCGVLTAGAFKISDFLPSASKNASNAERTLEKYYWAQCEFIRLQRAAGKIPRAAGSLEELHGQLNVDGRPLIPDSLVDGEDSGYRFIPMATYDSSGGSDLRYGFAICAVPVHYGVLGRRKHILRHGGQWWFKADGTNVPEKDWVWPDDPAMCAAGWICLDSDVWGHEPFPKAP